MARETYDNGMIGGESSEGVTEEYVRLWRVGVMKVKVEGKRECNKGRLRRMFGRMDPCSHTERLECIWTSCR